MNFIFRTVKYYNYFKLVSTYRYYITDYLFIYNIIIYYILIYKWIEANSKFDKTNQVQMTLNSSKIHNYLKKYIYNLRVLYNTV